MLFKVILFLLLALCMVGAVIVRMQYIVSYKERTTSVIASPLSEAVSQIVGIAGGIYVALVLLFSFLEIEFPQQIQIANVTLNPLALCSVLLACMQPIVSVLWKQIKQFLAHMRCS